MKNKDQHHYGRKGEYLGRSSETGPYAWIGKLLAILFVLYLLGKMAGSN